MKTEELLKNISSLLKKHEMFLNSNSELFYAIEDRLLKAIDDNDNSNDEQDIDPRSYDEEPEDDSYGEEPEDGDISEDDLDQEDINSDDNEEQDSDSIDADAFMEKLKNDPEFLARALAQNKKDSAAGVKQTKTRARDWKPNPVYSPEHKKEIDALIQEGFTPREAEREAGAHKFGANYNPSLPSAKKLEALKRVAGPYMKAHGEKKLSEADAAVNQNLATTAEFKQHNKEIHEPLNEKLSAFITSPEALNMSPRQLSAAKKAIREKHHEENPEHKEKAASFTHTDIAKKNKETADQRKEEEILALLGGGHFGEDDSGVVGQSSKKEKASISAVDTRDRSLPDWESHPKNIEAQKADETENQRRQEAQDALDEEDQSQITGTVSNEVGSQSVQPEDKDEDSGSKTLTQDNPYAWWGKQNPEFIDYLKQQNAQKKLAAGGTPKQGQPVAPTPGSEISAPATPAIPKPSGPTHEQLREQFNNKLASEDKAVQERAAALQQRYGKTKGPQ
jgi:hypothetical protein